MHRTFGIATAVLSLMSATACGDKKDDNRTTLTLGVLLDRTGPTNGTEQYGETLTLATQNLSDALAQSSAFQDFKVGYSWQDGQSNGTVAAPEGAALVASGAHGLITDANSTTLGILGLSYDADTTNDLNVPVISVSSGTGLFNLPTATDADPVVQASYRDANKWHYALLMANNVQTPATIDLQRREATSLDGDTNGDGHWKIDIVASDDGVGSDYTNGLTAAANAVKGSQDLIIEVVKFPPSANVATYDWSSLLDKLVDNQTESTTGGAATVDYFPDTIIPAAIAQFDAAIVKQYALRQLSTPEFTHLSTFLAPNIFATLPNGEANGMIGTTHAVWDFTSGTAVRDQYDAKYDHTVNDTSFRVSKAYDAAILMALGHFAAAQAAGVSVLDVTGEQVRDGIATLNDPNGTPVDTTVDGLTAALDAIAAGEAINLQGATANLDFSVNRRIKNAVQVYTVQGQGFELNQDFYYDCAQAGCPRIDNQ